MERTFRMFIVMISITIFGWMGPSHAAWDLVDTNCDLYCKGKIQAVGYLKQKVVGHLFVSFYESGYVSFIDESGFEINGFYGFDTNDDFHMYIPGENMADFVLNNLGIYSGYVDVEVTKSHISSTLKPKKNGLSMNFEYQLGIEIYAGGQEIEILYDIKGKGEFSPPREGSSWRIDNTAKLKLGKIKSNGVNTWLLHLGPNDDEGLTANEFIIYEVNGGDQGYLMTGLYSQSGKKITLKADEYEFTDFLDFLSLEALEGTEYQDAYVWYSTEKITATFDGKSGLNFKCKGKFMSDVSKGFVDEEWKGRFNFSGTGVPVQ